MAERTDRLLWVTIAYYDLLIGDYRLLKVTTGDWKMTMRLPTPGRSFCGLIRLEQA